MRILVFSELKCLILTAHFCRIAYVELASVELVQKALELNGTNVMGQSIGVQLAEAERNKQPATSDP